MIDSDTERNFAGFAKILGEQITDEQRAARYRRKLQDLCDKADDVCRMIAQDFDASTAARILADEVDLVRRQLEVEEQFKLLREMK